MYESETVRIKVCKGGLLLLENIDNVVDCLNRLVTTKLCGNETLNRINQLNNLPFIKRITPVSHWTARNYSLNNLLFKIEFEDYIHNKYIKESIGYIELLPIYITKRKLTKEYNLIKEERIKQFDSECYMTALRNNKKYQELICDLQKECKRHDELSLNIRICENEISLFNGNHHIYSYYICNGDITGFENSLKEEMFSQIKNQTSKHNVLDKYAYRINTCKNKLWSAHTDKDNSIHLNLYDHETKNKYNILCLPESEDIEKDITSTMNALLDWIENFEGIRFMET